MKDLIKRALANAGYDDCEPTESSIIECFTDYVDAGIWRDIEMDDVEDITVNQMCRALIRL
jgi:hypothetical protein